MTYDIIEPLHSFFTLHGGIMHASPSFLGVNPTISAPVKITGPLEPGGTEVLVIGQDVFRIEMVRVVHGLRWLELQVKVYRGNDCILTADHSLLPGGCWRVSGQDHFLEGDTAYVCTPGFSLQYINKAGIAENLEPMAFYLLVFSHVQVPELLPAYIEPAAAEGTLLWRGRLETLLDTVEVSCRALQPSEDPKRMEGFEFNHSERLASDTREIRIDVGPVYRIYR